MPTISSISFAKALTCFTTFPLRETNWQSSTKTLNQILLQTKYEFSKKKKNPLYFHYKLETIVEMWQLRICFLSYSFEDCWIQNTSYSHVYIYIVLACKQPLGDWYIHESIFKLVLKKMSINQFGLQFLKDSIPPPPLIEFNEWWTQIENLHLLQMILYPNGLTNKK